MQIRGGEGVQKLRNFADVICKRPQEDEEISNDDEGFDRGDDGGERIMRATRLRIELRVDDGKSVVSSHSKSTPIV